MEEQYRHETFDEGDNDTLGFWWIDAPGTDKRYITVSKVPDIISMEFVEAFHLSYSGLGIRLWNKPSAEELKKLLQVIMSWIDDGGLDRTYE